MTVRHSGLALAAAILISLPLGVRAQPELGAQPIQGLGEGLPVCVYIPLLAYPAAVTERHLGGIVMVRAYVDESGRVYDAELMRSELPELFIVEALKAARLSRFRPARQNGRGLRSTVLMPLRFHPQAPAPPPARAEEAVRAPVATPAATVPEPEPAASPPVVTESAPPAEQQTVSTLRVVDAGFGRGVSARQLEGRGEIFAEGDRVHFWMQVEGARPGETVKHIWIYRGRAVQEIRLTIKDSAWRSWSYKTLFPGMTGAWLLELRDESGHLIGSWSFHCE